MPLEDFGSNNSSWEGELIPDRWFVQDLEFEPTHLAIGREDLPGHRGLPVKQGFSIFSYTFNPLFGIL